MIFVKSEALLIFLPPLTLLFALVSFWQLRSRKQWMRIMGIFLGIVMAVALPWTLFKFALGLTFGNMTQVSSFQLVPHPGVPSAIFHGLFYTGSFLIFFPVLVLLLALTWHFWRRDTLGILIVFLAIVFTGQYGIYYLTPLAVEAIRHTGFSRGIVQLLPSMVFVAVLLLQKLFGRDPWKKRAAS